MTTKHNIDPITLIQENRLAVRNEQAHIAVQLAPRVSPDADLTRNLVCSGEQHDDEVIARRRRPSSSTEPA